MFEKLWNAQTAAAKRRIHFTFRDATTGDNVNPSSVTGKKVDFRLDGGATLVTTTNDVVVVNATSHLGAGYIELTAGELTAFGQGELLGSVHGITGVKVEDLQATLYPFDPADPGLTAASIATQVRAELATELGDIVGLATGAGTLTSGERNAIADALLARNQKGGSSTGFSVANALAGGALSFVISGSTITIKNGDGTTAYTRTLTRDATGLLFALLGAA